MLQHNLGPNQGFTAKLCRNRTDPYEIRLENKNKNKNLRRNISGHTIWKRQSLQFKSRQITKQQLSEK